MAKKIRVAVLFGGRSAEHEVSLQSARSIIEALDRDRYDVLPIGIDKDGRWFLNDASALVLNADNPKLIALNKSNTTVTLVPYESKNKLITLNGQQGSEPVDVVFPVLHGTYGEDGTIQGLLKLANLPYVGPSVLGSAVGMDKDVAKRLLRDAGIPISRFVAVNRGQRAALDFEALASELGLPMFVKPANLGSSVGVSKVRNRQEFEEAVDHAFEFDQKILIEENISGREIECAVLGNEEPISSIPGEIVPQHDFYSYEAKYIDEKGATLEIPAKLPPHVVARAQELAVKTFKTLCCEGMSRVDFFLRGEDELFVNEINTIPGFTKISMYPKLFEASGIPYRELVTRLIELAIARFERDNALKTNRDS